jgi:hypothetical protein
MATKLLIVHGYSDGSTSFTALGDFLVNAGAYRRQDIFYLNYSSMDDEATFRDFADKLDADYRARFAGERIDVICHSTGSLVVRAWLAMHAVRSLQRALNEDCPVDRLVCLAPANFGSDLARLGQSFLGKFRSTFFNQNSHQGDTLESGKNVLHGLEPASPFQWELSFEYDLHARHTYFCADRPDSQRCYPYVLAAGEAYDGIEAKVVKQRGWLGTDGTVRIAGTSLNTRACSLDFRQGGPQLQWWNDCKFPNIPFAVFAGFNHGSIANPATPGFAEPLGPGTQILEVLKPGAMTLDGYSQHAARFEQLSELNYARLPVERQARFQQFFFRVRDDVNQVVEDYYIDFHVARRDGTPHEELTLQFDADFQHEVTVHSTTPSHRVFMMNCSRLEEFYRRLRETDTYLVLEVTGVSALPDVRYQTSRFVAFDPGVALGPGEPALLFPNTTTLVDVVLNRMQTNRLLTISGVAPERAAAAAIAPGTTRERTGRAALVRPDDNVIGIG